MTGALRRFVLWIRELVRTKREPYHAAGELFLELDLSEVRAQLRPAERGSEDGDRNLPPTDATNLDQTEREIAAFIVGQQKRAHDICEQQVSVYDERVRNLAVTFLHADTSGRCAAGCADLRALGDRGRNELFDLQRRVTSLAGELFAFRAQHRLTRDAVYPESRTWHVALLGVLILVETVLNGLMLAQGTVYGRIEGLAQALALSLCNIAIAFMIGRVAMPLLHYRKRAVAFAGAIILICSAAASVGFNLLVGHYRDALGGVAPENAARDAATLFAEDPLHLADLNSWALCALGLTFGTIAAVDTYRMDDSYWGYGRLWRRNELARKDFVAERQHLTAEASDVRDDILDTLRRSHEDVARAGQHIGTLRRQQQSVIERFVSYEAYLERVGHLLLSEYRTANARQRSAPRPTYFDDDWCLPRQVVPLLTLASDLTDAGATLDQYRIDIITAFNDAVIQIKSVEDLVATGEMRLNKEHHAAL